MESQTFGKTRSEQEKNLRSEGYNSLTDEQLSRCEHIESKLKDSTGSAHNSVSQSDIDAAITYDKMDSVSRRDRLGVVRSMVASEWYRENFDKINWGGK
jgi:hypothetical protein